MSIIYSCSVSPAGNFVFCFRENWQALPLLLFSVGSPTCVRARSAQLIKLKTDKRQKHTVEQPDMSKAMEVLLQGHAVTSSQLSDLLPRGANRNPLQPLSGPGGKAHVFVFFNEGAGVSSFLFALYCGVVRLVPVALRNSQCARSMITFVIAVFLHLANIRSMLCDT